MTFLRPETLYFAFGSNLSLQKMAQRCPDSRYIGVGRLHQHRFPVNERGFANAVPSESDYVEGLCFRLSKSDERQLDRCEGVPDAYQKNYMQVETFVADINLVGCRVVELADRLLSEEIENRKEYADKQGTTSNQFNTAVIDSEYLDGRTFKERRASSGFTVETGDQSQPQPVKLERVCMYLQS